MICNRCNMRRCEPHRKTCTSCRRSPEYREQKRAWNQQQNQRRKQQHGQVDTTTGVDCYEPPRIQRPVCHKCFNLAHRLTKPCPRCGLKPAAEVIPVPERDWGRVTEWEAYGDGA